MISKNLFALLRQASALGITLQLSAVLHAQSAPPTNSLQLWVKADAGVTSDANGLVEKWADQSGHGNDAAQTDDAAKPTFVANAANGKPVVRFDGASDYLDVASASGLDIVGDIATFAVIRVDDYGNYNSIWGKTAGPDGNLPAPNDWYLSVGSGVPQFFRGDASAFQAVGAERPIRADAYAVVGVRQAGTSVTHYLNGSTNGVGEITTIPVDAGTNLKIGSREDLFTKMKGDIAELLIYSDALTDAQVNTTVNYLRNKYGITNTPPSVAIAAPTNNTSIAVPATINVTVNATDPDGAISKVSLLANGSVLATASAAPYHFAVTVETPGTISFSAVATDDRDATATSTNVTVTLTGAETPALTPNSHLKLWLKGDTATTVGTSGGVTVWADQSGNNNDALQGDETFAPTLSTLNGKPALHFDGSDDFMDVADSDLLSITGDISAFYVARFEDFSGFRGVFGKTSGNQPRPYDYYLASGSGVPNFTRGYTTNDTENVNQGVAAAGAVTANTAVFLGVQQQGTNITHYLNGAPFGTGVITLTPQDMDTPLKIGSRDDFATKMKGDIAEILLYDAALSSNELANVRQYLATKYNIPALQLSNVSPTLQITGPTAGTNLPAANPINVTATAADADGSIIRVDFFANGLPIGNDTTAPFTASFGTSFSGPVSLTAVATDNLGRKTTSAAVSFNVTGGETAPVPTGGLALWLRPDHGILTNASGMVTQWQDSSGNGNNATQTDGAKAPALVPANLNGFATLNFDGDDDYLQVANSATIAIEGDITTFFVVNVADYETYRAIWAKTSVNLPAANDYYLLPNTGEPRYYHGNGGSGIAQVTGTLPVPSGMFVTAGYVLNNGTATHYLNGAENGSAPLTAAGADTGKPLLIGTRADFVTKFRGDFAELLIYGRALTESERTQVQDYLQSKYFGQATGQTSLTATQGSNNTLVFAWPGTAEGFSLESSTSLGAGAAWTAVAEPVVAANGQNTVTVQSTGTARFFRLRK